MRSKNYYEMVEMINNPKKLYNAGKRLRKMAKKDKRKSIEFIKEYKDCRKIQKNLSLLAS